MIGKFVIVRASGAGVHCGELVEEKKNSVTLKDARRIWRWRGANTLNELSIKGADESWTRISEPVKKIKLRGAHELILCEDSAKDNLSKSRWGA